MAEISSKIFSTKFEFRRKFYDNFVETKFRRNWCFVRRKNRSRHLPTPLIPWARRARPSIGEAHQPGRAAELRVTKVARRGFRIEAKSSEGRDADQGANTAPKTTPTQPPNQRTPRKPWKTQPICCQSIKLFKEPHFFNAPTLTKAWNRTVKVDLRLWDEVPSRS